jgi:hypothetical protein
MQTNTDTKPTNEPPKPRRLRDDEDFMRLYTHILGNLYSRFEYAAPAEEGGVNGLSAQELQGRCRSLAQLAYCAACHAHAQLEFAEPYTDQEIAAFNDAINKPSSGNGN